MRRFLPGALAGARLVLAVVVVFLQGVRAAPPAVPAPGDDSPLTPARYGELLIGELGCASCHARPPVSTGAGAPPYPDRAAPDLSAAGWRVAPEFMERFIADPAAAHPGTVMPGMLARFDSETRRDAARALTHFLVSISDRSFRREPIASATAAFPDIAVAGREIYESVGCVACHGSADGPSNQPGSTPERSLAHVSDKYSRASLSEFLFQPLRVRPSGRMPDMALTRAEADAIAAHLMGDADADAGSDADMERHVETLIPDPILVARGARLYEQLNCAACHALEGIPAPRAKRGRDLAELNGEGGCLAADDPSTPRYDLSSVQVRAIRAALAGPDRVATDRSRVDATMYAFNCVLCHVRDDYGGVSRAIDPFFTTSEPELGNEARIPPPLTGIGAKLKPAWIRNVLFDGGGIRPYMRTRMPRFGEANLRHLPDLFARVDAVEPMTIPDYAGEERKRMREAGHLLTGDQGLNCVACHNFNGVDSPGFKGMDLTALYDRLTPGWFYHYMLDPGRFRPGTVMPDYWPGGVAARTDILGGDTDLQIKAIWHFLSLGRSARQPSGIRTEGFKLVVTDRTRTYRGRSRIAGYRGIAVGHPGGVNFAFNAQNGSLTGVWLGDFVSVGWQGQGAGDFNPLSRPITFAQDLAFYELPDENEPWPLRPRTDRDNPVNPDPLYPRQHGYQFKGYSLDDRGIPAFLYRIGKIDVEDRIVPDPSTHPARLVRTFTFTRGSKLKPDSDRIRPPSGTLYFRALTGDIERVSDRVFRERGRDIQVIVPPTEILVRPISGGDPDDEPGEELLLRFAIPSGQSTARVIYEWSRK